ncbi:Uncharacterized protein PECH_005196 [Penicillium ucsense]|uniref:Uncharacterized protein n=1 Tax=Penicillium ucsense TaxID=2839758 RepID=A0A8J8W750_9EURO|nr:Uncharacterized protein PECM_005396 [Penicillium ucsense]KAF7736566.1 Uncharacterized protein PECH_005196 [Penicillium ucsense]
MDCAPGSDNVFGPRVLQACRPFDFTLLFEDTIFAAVPAATFLLLAVFRLPALFRGPVKVDSHRLATYKLGSLAVLLTLQILHVAFQTQAPILRTDVALAASILQVVATATAGLLSWLEDQRSVRPSDIMVLYFFIATLLAIPRARTLWLLPPMVETQAIVWTLVAVATAAVLCLESIHKTRTLMLAYKQSSKEYTSSFWVRSFFIWMLPLFQNGFSSILALHDMPEVDHDLQGRSTEDRLLKTWSKNAAAQKSKLVRVVFRAYLWPFLSAVVPRLCLTGFKFCQPFLISATVGFLSDLQVSDRKHYGPSLVGAFVLTYLGMTISTAVYWRQAFRFNTMMRAGLVSLIYRQTNKLEASEFKSESAITLMGTDVQRISRQFRTLHEAWAAPIDVAVAVFLLARQLGIASVIPAIISIFSVLATIPVSKMSRTAQKNWLERVQARLAITSSMLHDMKSVKALSLTEKLLACVAELRSVELQVSKKFRRLVVGQVVLSNAPTSLAPFATFVVYAIIQSVRGNQTLLASRMFTSLSLISLMTDPLLIFIQTLSPLWESLGSFSRIEDYCRKAPIEESASSGAIGNELEPSSRPPSFGTPGVVLEMRNATFSWTADGPRPLHGINVAFAKKEIIAIIGPVGCGKSTFLESALGETTLRDGTMSAIASPSVAYCPQTPWIMNDTIRQNIIGPVAYDPKWYNFVIWACALEQDLESISSGDMSKCGSSGISLSGGQKQRISLARAVYSRAPTVLLDDVFSGLDNKTMVTIMTRLLASGGHFRESGKTVIFATHNHRLLPYVDRILILDNGTISKMGSYKELQSDLPQDEDDNEPGGRSEDTITTRETAVSVPLRDEALATIEETIVDADVDRRDGKWSVYTYYCRAAGWILSISLVVVTFLYSFAQRYTVIWLQDWANANENNPDQKPGKYIGIYALLVGIATVNLFYSAWVLLVPIITNTGRNMHSQLLRTTLGAPFSFFQRTDAGLTTNRFSQDLELIDMDLPIEAINVLASFGECSVQLILLCILGKYLAVAVPVLVAVLYLVQSYYLRTSRQVRLLDIEARSPLFTHFVETMNGIKVIRALRWQDPFQARLQDLLNESQKPFYMLFCIRQWLQLVLDCIVMGLAVVLVSLVVSLREKFSASSVGVALNLILVFNQDLMLLLRSWTMLETSIGAVARIKDFVDTTPSEERSGENLSTVPPTWPSQGQLIFDRVVASYGPEFRPALDNLSVKIESGQKIAVCGPSGSGKTSFILGLLQMVEIKKGRIVLDGIDLSTLPRNTVRSRFNVVSQEPFFMPGTLRFNLDREVDGQPVADATLIRALEAVGLWRKVSEDCARGSELDQPLLISDWSMGERQLLALARALVMNSPILILDEAMSSVDWETEATMQAIIDREFKSQTVISVIHRLRYIDRYDRVALMKRGRLVEYASPAKLLSTPSEFASFYRARMDSP